jgi:hypothetical protein
MEDDCRVVLEYQVWRRALPSGQTDYHNEILPTSGVPPGEKLARAPNDAPLAADDTAGFPNTNGTVCGHRLTPGAKFCQECGTQVHG